MKPEEIIKMAREAGIYHEFDSEGQWDGLTDQVLIQPNPPHPNDLAYGEKRTVEILERVVQLVAKHTLMNIDPKSSMSYREGYEAGLDAGRAEQQADMESLYAMYQQACKQRDMLMDQQRAQIAAIKGQIQ